MQHSVEWNVVEVFVELQVNVALYKIQFFPTKLSGRVYQWKETSWEVTIYIPFL